MKYDEIDYWTKLLVDLNRRWTIGPNYVPGSDSIMDHFEKRITNSYE
jgi:hypothetical protein